MAKATSKQKQHFIKVPFFLPQHPDHDLNRVTPEATHVRADAIVRLEFENFQYEAEDDNGRKRQFREKGVRIYTNREFPARDSIGIHEHVHAVGVTVEQMLDKVNRVLNLLDECPLLPEPKEETPKK